MSAADVLRARAAEWRDRARYQPPLVRARMLSKAESIERDLDGAALSTPPTETAAAVSTRDGAPCIKPITYTAGPTLDAWAGRSR